MVQCPAFLAFEVASRQHLSIWTFLIWIAGLFVVAQVTGFLFASYSGWRALAGLYKAKATSKGPLIPFNSVCIGKGQFPVCYSPFVRLDAEGIYLSHAFFLLGMPPLLIPWKAIAECQVQKFQLRKATVIHLSLPRQRIVFFGYAGRFIGEAWANLHKKEADTV